MQGYNGALRGTGMRNVRYLVCIGGLSESLKFRTHIAFEIYAFENFERNVVFERNDVYVFERNGGLISNATLCSWLTTSMPV